MSISTQVTLSPTVDTSAYATGDLIGGKLTLDGATREGGGSGVIQSLVLVDQHNQKKELDIVFFHDDPSNTTFTDNAALDVADADMTKIIGVVTVAATDYKSFADNAVATIRNLGLAFRIANLTTPARKLYAAIVAREAVTYAAAADLRGLVTILQDQ